MNSSNDPTAKKTSFRPELLSPAGSPAALRAAVEAGADAVYFGASGFNARAGARNFSDAEMRDAVAYCHAAGVRVYLTLNTLIYDREMGDYLAAAERAYIAGVDALIVADLGGAAAIHRTFPDLPIHASTQMSGHSTAAAELLAKLGFSRMVLAREMSLADISYFTAHSPIEAEVFIHGALCVCHSGQCLFSSMVGGRSGNRGECAQPCRLPYNGGAYPLSLKDLCLAGHIPELAGARVASLKIEGRMKGSDYVGPVTSVYRRLIDEERAASRDEIEYLESVFSRSGFTDGYFEGKISSAMLGTRTEADKKSRPVSVSREKCSRELPPIELPPREHRADENSPRRPSRRPVKRRTAYMYSASQLTEKARNYFDLCFLPLHVAARAPIPREGGCFIGAALPPVIFDSELAAIRRMLESAAANGVRDLLIGNPGHIGLAEEFGMRPHGDIRLNICNRETAAAYEASGIEDMLLSPELTLPRIRDIGGRTLAVVYGRLPLMITEKCAGRECSGCRACADNKNILVDRRGARFPVLREQKHRSLIVNSLPTSMSDKQKLLDEYGVRGRHFIFTVETPREVDAVITAFERGTPTGGEVRRIAIK